MKLIANVRVGRADVKVDLPSHVPNIREGNETGSFERERGLRREGERVVANAARSTGVDPQRHDVLDLRMPGLSPP
jgi:hypothetical protein